MFGMVVMLSLSACDSLRAAVMSVYPNEYEAESLGVANAGTGPVAIFDGPDTARPRLNVRLRPAAGEFSSPTDIQFPPGEDDRMLVLEKGGSLWLLHRDDSGTFGARQQIATLDVLTRSEQGLLGAAFHPRFADNGKLYLHYVARQDGHPFSQIAEWTVADPGAAQWSAGETALILELRQPYANHNAGQLVFGPDGMLYVGFGDGGWRDDPHGHGQDTMTWLGAMLRIDVDRTAPGQNYTVPVDNPFISDTTYRPEIWATGLRNPWRYSFDPRGRLIVADVGQNAWEEVSLVPPGANLGWKNREGRHCFTRQCPDAGTNNLFDPIYAYDHSEGQSITGGYVVTSAEDTALSGRYVFGDFISGRMWAIDLPETTQPAPPLATVYALGRWGMLLSTFGRDASGRLFVADYGTGQIYRVEG